MDRSSLSLASCPGPSFSTRFFLALLLRFSCSISCLIVIVISLLSSFGWFIIHRYVYALNRGKSRSPTTFFVLVFPLNLDPEVKI